MPLVKCPKCSATNDEGKDKCTVCGGPLPRIRIVGHVQGQNRGQTTFRRGQVVANRYTIMDLVGKGGMGCIYKVHDNTLNEQVALKTLLPQFVSDKLVVERFFNEARIARQLSHPFIVRVHDIGIADSTIYISMELLQGKSLRAVLDHQPAGQRLPVTETLRILIQLCKALEYAHKYTIHRDIKPENVMIDGSGNVKLMDFGISKLMTNNQLTGTSVVMGTPHYMSPEQLKDSRNVDARADVYSVGVMLYEMLTGNLPTGVPKPASQIMQTVPASLDGVIAKCVEPDPDERYQNITELRDVLEAILRTIESDGSEIAVPAAAPPKAVASASRSSFYLGLVLCVIIALAAAAGMAQAEKRRRALVEENTAHQQIVIKAMNDPFLEFPSFTAFENALNTAQRMASRNVDGPVRQDLYDDSVAAWETAHSLFASDEAEAKRQAQIALQGFMALCVWRNDMTYVPAGYVNIGGNRFDVPPFLVDTHPVTQQEFDTFARSIDGNWNAEPRARAWSTDPEAWVTLVTYYDAQAFAARAGMALPTALQWTRALDHFRQVGETDIIGEQPEFWEWTRTATGHESEPEYLPTFGDTIVVYQVSKGTNAEGQTTLQNSSTTNSFDTPNQLLGFRCVKEIPTSPGAVAAVLGS